MLLLNDCGELGQSLKHCVSPTEKDDWNDHLGKLLSKYNSRSLPLLYLLTYMDAKLKAYTRIWKGYQIHIQKHIPGQHTVFASSYVDVNDANSPQYINSTKCQYTCGSDPITVYHIFARIPTQNE